MQNNGQEPSVGEKIANKAVQAVKSQAKKGMRDAVKRVGKTIAKAALKIAKQIIHLIIHFFATCFPANIIVIAVILAIFAAMVILDLVSSNEDAADGFTAIGENYSAFGCNVSRDDFIQACTSHSVGDFSDSINAAIVYDTCKKYNVNPCYIIGMAIQEGQGKTCRRKL